MKLELLAGCPVYNSFVEKKNSGQVVKIEDVSFEDLTVMFIDEIIIDAMLCDLFDVTRPQIKKRRYSLGVIKGQIITERMQADALFLAVMQSASSKEKGDA